MRNCASSALVPRLRHRPWARPSTRLRSAWGPIGSLWRPFLVPRSSLSATPVQQVRSCSCRSMESAIKLAERFIAGVTKPAPPRRPRARAAALARRRSGVGLRHIPGPSGIFLLAKPASDGLASCRPSRGVNAHGTARG
jgi:hypothetical protein